VDPATPLLLRHAPSSLPIRKPIGAIVGISRGRWQCRLYWRQDRNERWHCGWTSLVVDSAAPLLLVSCPSVFRVHSAIEWVHRTGRYWTSGWQRAWRCGRRRRWWCGRWRGERSRRYRHRWLRQGGGGPSGGTAPAHGAATEVLLRLRPRCFPHQKSTVTIVWESGAWREREQPQQQREQKQTQATTRDDASEIPSRSDVGEITTCSDVLVCRLLYEPSLARPNV